VSDGAVGAAAGHLLYLLWICDNCTIAHNGKGWPRALLAYGVLKQ